MAADVKTSQEGPHSDRSIHAHNFRGGVWIALIAAFFFLSTFLIAAPTVPRILSILMIVVGIATAVGFVPVRGPQDYYGGLVLILLAILAMVASGDLPGQRGFAFGPGTAPRLFSGLLAILGAAVALVGVFSKGPAIEPYKIRGPALVLIGIFLFAALIRPFGLVIASYLAFMVSITGSTEMRWVESFIAAAAMTLFCVLLFVYALNLPFQLWPQDNASAILFKQFEEIVGATWVILLKLNPFHG